MMALVASGIAYRHPGGGELFSGIELDVNPGERVAIAAPSGAGKTTLCRILAGYLRPMQGTVSIDGIDISRFAGRPLPVQLLWQQPELAFDPRARISTSLLDAGPVPDESLERLLDRFDAKAAWLKRYPHELSGGELMRLSMVRALLVEPAYLIADEATAMLDAVTQAQLMCEMVRLTEEGVGLVFVSHSPSLVNRVSTRVFNLSSAKL